MAKTTCPITRDEFDAKAQTLVVSVTVKGTSDEIARFTLTPREFSTGSLGWYAGDKALAPVAGKECTLQCGFNLTVVGSKELPERVKATPKAA